MEKVRISLSQELYYWQCFYNRKLRANLPSYSPPYRILRFFPWGIEYTSFMQLEGLRFLNFLSFSMFIYYIFRVIGWDFLKVFIHNLAKDKSVFLVAFVGFFLLLLTLDLFFIYIKRYKIFTTCEQFSKKRRTVGKIMYWIYVLGTFPLFFWVGELL